METICLLTANKPQRRRRRRRNKPVSVISERGGKRSGHLEFFAIRQVVIIPSCEQMMALISGRVPLFLSDWKQAINRVRFLRHASSEECVSIFLSSAFTAKGQRNRVKLTSCTFHNFRVQNLGTVSFATTFSNAWMILRSIMCHHHCKQPLSWFMWTFDPLPMHKY